MVQRKIRADQEASYEFHNQVDYCIGTGRMGLALQKEYFEQLKLVQDEIGFHHIRGHGLFCDDMAIYQEREVDGVKIVEYNYTYLDMVMDSYRELHLKPFLELGFMPSAMASGEQTVFYWKGNVTPPKSYEEWRMMVQAMLRHLCERYGTDEVVTWPVEVWNEPNLTTFWKDADMMEYFRLFQQTFAAVKEVDERFRVGGPAVCGGSDEVWIRAFMEFCHEQNIPLDFVTRHHYNTERPERLGHYGYANLTEAERGLSNLHTTREIIDRFPEYRGLQIHITEFNTSYIPNCPLHDTNQNAAYIAHQLSRLGEDNESYSYWTFGDVFEEQGVPFTPFHGGFGLVANGCIKKPTYWSFVFFKRLKQKHGTCIYRDDNTVLLKYEDGSLRGIAWNATTKRKDEEISLEYQIKADAMNYYFQLEKVDEGTCNPLKVWHDMGEPANLSTEQKNTLRQACVPALSTKQIVASQGELRFILSMKENSVFYFELKPVQNHSDRGYSYERVMQVEKNT